jgi:4,5-DOPA dioxygenase extradiol
MPAVFFGHGNPMNALWENKYTRAWRKFGEDFPNPKAILCVSAHWYIRGTKVTAMAKPRTIHDFGGFPKELNEYQYPAMGSFELADRTKKLLAPLDVELDRTWGLDHGTWAVLCHTYPEADIPIVQLSVDGSKPASFHYDLGRRLAQLRDEGYLVVGSGNVVHNLGTIRFYPDAEPFDWAVNFNEEAKAMIAGRRHSEMVNYQALGAQAKVSIPTPDHYLPLLYILGIQGENERAEFLVDGVEHGSISMLSVAVGGS